MSDTALGMYRATIKAQQRGESSPANAGTPFEVAKGAFYADARFLINDIRTTYRSYEQSYPPYGLRTFRGEAVERLSGQSDKRWTDLERAMAITARYAFNETVPSIQSCPYHEALRNLGHAALPPIDDNVNGLDRFREVVVPGALFAPATIVNLLRRLPAMARITGAKSVLVTLAANSMGSLLAEPLGHPQQLAKAFTFCLAEGIGGSDQIMDRATFLPDDLIAQYVTLEQMPNAQERLVWSRPTTDFTLRARVGVADRLRGPEYEEGDHITYYDPGTRLGDIAHNEATLGCPGNQMAYDMWRQAIQVIAAENLWEPSAAQAI